MRLVLADAGCLIPIHCPGKKTVVLPLASFDWGASPASGDDPGAEGLLEPGWKPIHHIHYAMRVMDISDDLPKFAGSSHGPRFEQSATAAE